MNGQHWSSGFFSLLCVARNEIIPLVVWRVGRVASIAKQNHILKGITSHNWKVEQKKTLSWISHTIKPKAKKDRMKSSMPWAKLQGGKQMPKAWRGACLNYWSLMEQCRWNKPQAMQAHPKNTESHFQCVYCTEQEHKALPESEDPPWCLRKEKTT